MIDIDALEALANASQSKDVSVDEALSFVEATMPESVLALIAEVRALRETVSRDGWHLAPIEPTPAMLDTAVAFALNVAISSEYNWSAYMRDVWMNMLNAARGAK
ncbi:UNVERIFIED_ORG: hypothetical protein ABIC54_004465 [Burkholderia sp. 1263]